MILQRFGRLLLWLGALYVSAQCARSAPTRSPAAEELLRDEPGFLARQGRSWVEAQQQEHRLHALALSEDEKQQLAAFFSSEVLEGARLRVVNAIENPSFYSAYEELGKEFPLDFSSAVGLALVDTILVKRSHAGLGTDARRSVLFHELVHLEQYRLLGTEAYVERYIRAFVDGGYRYRSNPFEAQAFELQNRYRQDPDRVFVVADDVRRRFIASPN